ncbi:MAG: hemolysin III family protein [Myxococcales bacterium]|nr:hemolysin III family protein [Myxococcales bacterium]
MSGLTHLAGMLLSIAALSVLVTSAAFKGGTWHIVSFSIFGVSLVLMYAASSLYHLLPLSEEGVRALKRVDHMCIFVLIAGSYTPFCLVALRETWGWWFFGVAWTLAFAGILFKIFWLHAPRLLSTALYVAMGWIAIFAIGPLAKALPPEGLFWLILGGVIYTIGGIVYAFKWPNPYPRVFGFHEIWHLFVLGGSFCHFWAVLRHVLYIA